jgi:nicotinamidase/pyrazinamidase
MVDLQNDFCSGGNLAVPFGEDVVPIANALQKTFPLVIATKDWHPKDHISFASNHPQKKIGDKIKVGEIEQILWPDHCIQESAGSEFHSALDVTRINKIIFKGTDKKIDSYSAFFDNAHLRQTGLNDYLREHHVQDVYIMGLATDYCVKYSCHDAVALGFNVYVIEDACRGVELKKGDIEKAISEMKNEGVKIIQSRVI